MSLLGWLRSRACEQGTCKTVKGGGRGWRVGGGEGGNRRIVKITAQGTMPSASQSIK